MKRLFKNINEKRLRLKKIRKSMKVFKNGYKSFLNGEGYNQEVYYSIIDLFCLTNGRFLDKFHDKTISKKQVFEPKGHLMGVSGYVSVEKFKKYNNVLNQNGYVLFEEKIPMELIEKLKQFAFEKECVFAPKYDKKVKFDLNKIDSEIYKYNVSDLMNNYEVQTLIADPVLINFARNYLGCEPIFDFPFMWASPNFSNEASNEAAQMYHFDLDRIKWLKIFIYINDVDSENGPHYYIKGSHLSGNKPQHLLDRGYVRIKDEELESYYSSDDIVEIKGKAGAFFAGDTKCWHKGSVVKKGYRLVLQLQYTSSLFGAPVQNLSVKTYTPEFKNFCEENPYYATAIKFE